MNQALKVPVKMEKSENETKAETPIESTKKRRKIFTDLGARMQKGRTESLLCQINEYIQKECPELSTTQLLGYLVHRINIQSEKKIAQIGYEPKQRMCIHLRLMRQLH